MEYDDFYLIAEYGSDNWKGNFSPREIANNAYTYLVEFEESKAKGKPTDIMKSLIDLLSEDISDECEWWLSEIKEELKMI